MTKPDPGVFDVCRCGHPRGWHPIYDHWGEPVMIGECLERDCGCQPFRLKKKVLGAEVSDRRKLSAIIDHWMDANISDGDGL